VGGTGATGGGGAGGTAGGGAGGTAGTGGAAGTTGGGAGGSGGAAPTPPAANCTGCVQLSVPVGGTLVAGATAFQAAYEFGAAAPAQPFDLSDVETITWRVQALTPNASYYVQAFLQNGPPESPNYFGFYAGNIALAPATFAPGAWVDVVLDVAAIGAPVGDAGADAGELPPPVAEVDAGDGGVVALTAFDKSQTRTVGLQVGALATVPAGFVSIQVDSVTVVGTSNFTSKTFTANAEGLTLNTFQAPTGSLPTAFR
jgi:hypothetical protein